jgi:hypothetical protein
MVETHEAPPLTEKGLPGSPLIRKPERGLTQGQINIRENQINRGSGERAEIARQEAITQAEERMEQTIKSANRDSNDLDEVRRTIDIARRLKGIK